MPCALASARFTCGSRWRVVNQNFMKRPKLTWWLTLTTACGVSLAVHARQSDGTSAKPDTSPAILAAVSDQPAENEESTNTAAAEEQSSTNNSSESEQAEPPRH